MIETLLEQNVRYHYLTLNHNCAETLLAACNDTFDLNVPASSLTLVSGFGGGMFTGNTCGALCGCTAALATMLVESKAHETPDLPKAQRLLVSHFRQALGEVQCAKIKPNFHSSAQRCLNTCLMATKAMNKTLQELNDQGIVTIDPILFEEKEHLIEG